MADQSSISIIIPCRNEEKFISKCLDSILNNDYLRLHQDFGGQAKDKMEIFVVDGMSRDKTAEIVKKYIEKYPFIKLLDNPKFIASAALNIGIKASKGGIIIRMDAHAIYDKCYISKCVNYLKMNGADNVGGVISIIPRTNTPIGRGIARATSSFLGTGGARYKTGTEKFEEVDTVPFGCFRRDVFDRIGFFNENLKRSQDMEFNIRLKKSGGKIYLFTDIVSHYYVRSELKDFFVHNFKDGIWAIYPFKFTKRLFKLRHYIPLVFVSGLIITFFLGMLIKPFYYIFLAEILFYILVILYAAVEVSLKEKDATCLFSLPIALATRHFAYGFGSVFGIIKLLI